MKKKFKKLLENAQQQVILCGSCAAYDQCKLKKKETAIKCRNFWRHRPTSDFFK